MQLEYGIAFEMLKYVKCVLVGVMRTELHPVDQEAVVNQTSFI